MHQATGVKLKPNEGTVNYRIQLFGMSKHRSSWTNCRRLTEEFFAAEDKIWGTEEGCKASEIKNPRLNKSKKGFLKTGNTYFRTGGHYHRLRKLNYCVRNGNR